MAFLAAVAAVPFDRAAWSYDGQDQADKERSPTMEEWMDSWIKAQRAPDGALRLGKFADPIYFLVEPIGWKPNPGQRVPAVNVPKGFVTDLTSVPRPFFSLLRPTPSMRTPPSSTIISTGRRTALVRGNPTYSSDGHAGLHLPPVRHRRPDYLGVGGVRGCTAGPVAARNADRTADRSRH